jgi:hypothetical protein
VVSFGVNSANALEVSCRVSGCANDISHGLPRTVTAAKMGLTNCTNGAVIDGINIAMLETIITNKAGALHLPGTA